MDLNWYEGLVVRWLVRALLALGMLHVVLDMDWTWQDSLDVNGWVGWGVAAIIVCGVAGMLAAHARRTPGGWRTTTGVREVLDVVVESLRSTFVEWVFVLVASIVSAVVGHEALGLGSFSAPLAPLVAVPVVAGWFRLFPQTGDVLVDWLRGVIGGDGRSPAVGEIWWATIPFEEVDEAKDRPCLVIARQGSEYDVLMLTSQDKSGRAGYVPVRVPLSARTTGKSQSWLKTDRVIPRSRSDFRRFGWRADAATRQAVAHLTAQTDVRWPGAA